MDRDSASPANRCASLFVLPTCQVRSYLTHKFKPVAPVISQNPPSFNESQYDIILRRQRVRPTTGPSLKSTTVPSRFLNLPNDFEFAGWGTFNKIQLQDADYVAGEAQVKEKNDMKILGQYTASGLAGNVSYLVIFSGARLSGHFILHGYLDVILLLKMNLGYSWRDLLHPPCCCRPL